MSPANELFALYHQWRQLTEDEGKAIDSGAWHQVENCQAAKARLQLRIVEVSHSINAPDDEVKIRQLVSKLIHMEAHNSGRLGEKREATEAEQQALDKTTRTLQQLRLSYVPRTPAHWESYS